tara:strand:- start:2014 stop:2478 length:465 start_codon:yes stop_codon:yes gene_type:complete
MTYKQRHSKTTRIIELSADGTQTVSNGDTILFPNKRTSGGDAVTVTSGAISLSSSRSYFLQCSVSVERPSSSSDVIMTWYNATTNSALSNSNGAFKSQYNPSGGTSSTRKNGSVVAVMYIDNPTHAVKLVISGLSSGTTTILDSMNILITEIET